MSCPGQAMYKLCAELFPICRSITGNGVRQTLSILKGYLPQLTVHEVPSGTRAFDWQVPLEWNVNDAYIINPDGEKIIDFQQSNLHLVSYSVPVEKTMPLSELQQHLHSLPTQPEAIPYVTSYYSENWGFCLADSQRKSMKEGSYRVYIDSSLEAGSLTYGELLIPGDSEKEVLLSTNICHPSLANNELSGPVVATFLARWLLSLPARKYSYRMLYLPETIGSILYISKNLKRLQEKVVAGYTLTCLGDDRAYSYVPSRYGHTLADRAALHVLSKLHPDFTRYSYLQRGSDERQYCSPGVDLPVASVMRSKYREYPEYHTSLDNLKFISPAGLAGSFRLLQAITGCLEKNFTPRVTVYCEPRLADRNLYPGLGTTKTAGQVQDMLNLLAYCDGKNDLLQVAEIIGKPLWELYDMIVKLKESQLVEILDAGKEGQTR